MRNVSVKEAAEALGVTPRTIQYKLQNGELKGTRVKNQYGKDEWKIYPTKQIAEALSLKTQSGEEFPPLEGGVVDAEIAGEEFGEPPAWRERELERLELMAEKLVKPLADRIEAQAALIQDQGRTIAEQKRQLLLLPDLEKRAEDERKAAELKELEAEALRKQIAAVAAGQQQAEESRRQAQEEIERLKDEKDAHSKAIEELKAADEAKLAEKEAHAKAIEEQLQALSATVEELKKPKPSWWKKWFTSPEPPAVTK